MIERPWLDQYDAEVPGHLHYPDSTIQDFLVQQAEKNPDRTALICEGKSISYLALLTQSRNLAVTLIGKGLKQGDRVGICLPNTIEFVISFYGTLLAGGIVAALNPFYPLSEWNYQAGIVHPKILIGSASRLNELQVLQHSTKISELILVDLPGNESLKEQSGINSFLNLISLHPTDITLPKVASGDAAVLQFSGGTTGVPKAALALQRNVVANILQFKTWLSTLKEGQEIFLTVIPLHHVYGMVIGLNVGIAMGATIVLVPDGRDLEKILNLIQKHKVTFFPGVPSIYDAINHTPKASAGEINLRTIKACISGSAPLLQETRIKFEALTGGKLVEGYGLSEAPTATHCNPIQGENREGSIGLPLSDVDCKIVDLDNNDRQVETGESGELLIRSPQVMQGYYRSPQETRIALKDGWLHTGDIAKMDREGYFYIVGRRKELIKVNGLQVWPMEVENVLLKFPGVREAAVAGIPDDAMGEAVKAWLVPDRPGVFDFHSVCSFCRQFLAGYKIPKEVEIVSNLPKSPIGKTLRRELVKMHLEQKKKSGA
jgi:long-chain acyl-CoA synthetase